MKNNENVKITYANVPVEEYIQRIQGVYPENVLEKVQVFFGVGGARTIVENLVRNGFRNYILIDGDRIAPVNVATQGVFISEMGMYKTEAIRNRIHDINPNANVICVNKFLDDNMTDEDFENLLKEFPNKESKDFLIYGCTDSFEANKRSSILSLKYGISYIGAGMYQQGLAAEVIFIYPGVTSSCPRCLLRSRFEANENGYINDVTLAGWLTYILRMPSLNGRDGNLHIAHRYCNGNTYRICYDPQPTTLRDAQIISRAWADRELEYISTEIYFEKQRW